MARIAFFTERLPPDPDPISNFSFDLIRSLADQQHDIHVYSTYRPGEKLPPAHPQISVLLPFVNWGWLELPRLVPLLLDFRPEILHIIQPRAEALRGFTNAMSAIPGFANLIGKPSLVTSFYDLRADDLKRHKQLLMMSSAVTVSNDPQQKLVLAYLRELGKQTPVSLLPVPVAGVRREDFELSDDSGTASFAPDEGLTQFLESSPNLIFVPLNVSEHQTPEKLFMALARALVDSDRNIAVVGGGWGSLSTRERHRMMRILDDSKVGGRFFLTGSLSDETERLCLSKARVVLTASLPPESLGLARIIRGALSASALLAMSEKQANVDPLAWKSGENALICGDGSEDWANTLLEAMRSDELVERIKHRLPEFSRVEAIDQPGNVVSRIYSSVLERRRTSRNN